ncbi:hypothetical protein CR513_31061, partial [Mucuna pruriens]
MEEEEITEVEVEETTEEEDKSEACDAFKSFKAFVEKQSGCRIKALRTDRGQECPSKCVCDKTPDEAWSGRRSSIKHLRDFGCIMYAHVPNQLRKKLDEKGCEPMTFEEALSDEN